MEVELKFFDLDLINISELVLKYDLKSNLEFDSQEEFLISFLKKFGVSKVNELKGGFSFVCLLNGVFYVFRDVVGIKPVCLFFDELEGKFEFGSSLKDISSLGFEMNPRKYVVCDLKKRYFKEFDREDYYVIKNELNREDADKDYDFVRKKISNMFESAISKKLDLIGFDSSNIEKKKNIKVGILFSGGTDSTLIAFVLKKLGVDFVCYTASIDGGNISEGADIYYARKISAICNFDWSLCKLDINDVGEVTKEVIDLIGSRNYTKVSVALPLFVALRQAQKNGITHVFSGIGSEEIFADYKRNENISYDNINDVCLLGLKSLWVRDLYRDEMLAKSLGIKLHYPFLNDYFVNYGININSKFKIDKEKKINKIILRDILREFGLPEEMVSRSKKAAQYGSRSDRVFEKICRKMRIKKQEYLNSL